MVRNIVGSLVCMGRGEQAPDWLKSVLEGRDRRAAGMTAAPAGLYLTQVHYPAGTADSRTRSLSGPVICDDHLIIMLGT